MPNKHNANSKAALITLFSTITIFNKENIWACRAVTVSKNCVQVAIKSKGKGSVCVSLCSVLTELKCSLSHMRQFLCMLGSLLHARKCLCLFLLAALSGLLCVLRSAILTLSWKFYQVYFTVGRGSRSFSWYFHRAVCFLFIVNREIHPDRGHFVACLLVWQCTLDLGCKISCGIGSLYQSLFLISKSDWYLITVIINVSLTNNN